MWGLSFIVSTFYTIVHFCSFSFPFSPKDENGAALTTFETAIVLISYCVDVVFRYVFDINSASLFAKLNL